MSTPTTQTPSPKKRTTLIAAAVVLCIAAIAGIVYEGSHNAQAQEAPLETIAGKVDKGIVRIQPDQVTSFEIGKP